MIRHKNFLLASSIAMMLMVFLQLPSFSDAGDKYPVSAALKSAVFPGWGQDQNGDKVKGYSMRISLPVLGGMYLVMNQKVQQMELGQGYSGGQKEGALFWRDFCVVNLAACYLGGITDAYFSAENHNNKNNFVRKDPGTSLLLSAVVPGLGLCYVGDSVLDGTYFFITSIYYLNRAIVASSTEKANSAVAFGIYYLLDLATSYFAANAHNNNIDSQKKGLELLPYLDFNNGKMSLAFSINFEGNNGAN